MAESSPTTISQKPTTELIVIEREYNGTRIGHRQTDGYWNATAMCRANDKLLNDYWRLKSTQSFLGELSSVTGIPVTELVIIQQGGTPALQGTWVHRRVAMHLAQWCNARFAVLVSGWMEELFQTGRVELVPPSNDLVPTTCIHTISASLKAVSDAMQGVCTMLQQQQSSIKKVENRVGVHDTVLVEIGNVIGEMSGYTTENTARIASLEAVLNRGVLAGDRVISRVRPPHPLLKNPQMRAEVDSLIKGYYRFARDEKLSDKIRGLRNACYTELAGGPIWFNAFDMCKKMNEEHVRKIEAAGGKIPKKPKYTCIEVVDLYGMMPELLEIVKRATATPPVTIPFPVNEAVGDE